LSFFGDAKCELTVVHIGGSTRTWIAQPHYLNRGGSEGKYFIPCTLRVAIHVDQNVDPVIMNLIGCFPVTSNLMTSKEEIGGCKVTKTKTLEGRPSKREIPCFPQATGREKEENE